MTTHSDELLRLFGGTAGTLRILPPRPEVPRRQGPRLPPFEAPPRSAQVRRRPRNPAALSIRALAERLACGRDRVRALVAARAIKTIPWGRSSRVPAVEVERLEREGLPAAPGESTGRRRALDSR